MGDKDNHQDTRHLELDSIIKREKTLEERLKDRLTTIEDEITDLSAETDTEQLRSKLIECECERDIILSHLDKIQNYKKRGVLNIKSAIDFVTLDTAQLDDASGIDFTHNPQRLRNRDDIGDMGWSITNEQTLRGWGDALVKTSFVHDVILEHRQIIYDRLTLISVIVTLTISALSSLAVGVDIGSHSPIFDKLVYIGLFILSLISAIVAGIIKNKHYPNAVSDLSGYIVKVDNLYNEIKTILMLPCSMRPNAVEYLKNTSQIYLKIMNGVPTTNVSEQEMGVNKYGMFMRREIQRFNALQKYYSTGVSVIDIV